MEALAIDDIIEKYQDQRGQVIAALQDIQERYYYLPKQALQIVSEKMKIPLSRIYSIATFYNAFSLVPKGKYQTKVCLGTTCYVRGGEQLQKSLEEELNISIGETTADRKFSIDSVHCLGCCSIAPVITVNNKVYGRLQEEKVKEIINKYKQG